MTPLLYTEAVAKSDRLLKSVLERPDDASLLMVYGDALQARGDVRGALLTVQQQRQQPGSEGRRRALKLHEHELLTKHRAELVGPVARLPSAQVAWRLGFARELKVDVQAGELGALVETLRLPQFALLERLTVRLRQIDELDPLIEALPNRLAHVRLDALTGSDFAWETVVAALPPVPSLELWGGSSVDFDGLELPMLKRLRLTVDFENLTAEVMPGLEVLVLGNGEYVPPCDEAPEGLRLLRLLGSVYDDVRVAPQTRVINESLENEDGGGVGEIFRGGWGVADERAFVLTPATAPQIDDAVGELGKAWALTSCGVQVGGRSFSALEVRVGSPQPKLLAELATVLAAHGPAVEVAISQSNRDALLRGYRAGAPVEPLGMGPFREAENVWRSGVDHAFGFDPAWTLDGVLEALDAEGPRRSHGEPADARGEYPCATPLQPAADTRELDEYGDAYDDGEPALDWWAKQLPDEAVEPPQVDAPPVAQVEVHEEAAEPLEPEHHEEQGDADWSLVMAETPLELEGDGEERNPEEGLEHDDFDPDDVQAERGEPCFRCGRTGLEVDDCVSCGHEVCQSCAVEVKDDRRRCNVCR